ncbi:MAG: hypothetical protein KDJ26_06370 [Alphaproteobacteria bacterium]|jgi:hypothetical protein|nr:hypothetical protein [Alphaproteobacteria bacterium]MCB1551607.1 hypothetical protein [Alphaproteobacteria bacterium]
MSELRVMLQRACKASSAEGLSGEFGLSAEGHIAGQPNMMNKSMDLSSPPYVRIHPSQR